jgi:hypothetical protein
MGKFTSRKEPSPPAPPRSGSSNASQGGSPRPQPRAAAPPDARPSAADPRAAKPAPHSPPSHDQIAARAYEIWKSKGSPLGNDREDWFEAQQQLMH